jgi:hypothetical protein
MVRLAAEAVETALAAKTGGGADPWTVKVSGVDLGNPAAVRQIFHDVALGLDDGNPIVLDLSGCSGWSIGYSGIFAADKARYVSLVLPESITEIVDGSSTLNPFGGFTALKSISAPGVNYVGEYAFYGCTALETISLPAVRDIRAYAFTAASGTNTALTAVNFQEALSIGEAAFRYCIAINSITLPRVTSIGASAFAATSANANTALTALTGANLPEVLSIGNTAFQYCTALAAVDLPKVTSIGASAFAAASASPNTTLTTLNLQKVETIGGAAFRYYTAISSITLPQVTSIGSYAFAASSTNPNAALTSLDLATVTSIGSQAFGYCTGLESLKLGPEVPTLPNLSTTAGNGIFVNTGSSGTITISVPAAAQSGYAAAGWKAIAQGAADSGNIINYGTDHKEIAISTY